MKRNLLLTFLLVALFFTGVAQTNWCGTSYFDSIAIANDPSILENRNALEEFTKNYELNKASRNDTLFIPVVYHILHKYGSERISYVSVEKGIEKVNKAYNAENTDLNSVIASFQDIIGEANFKLRLAKLDPNGNPTTGIIYYDTELTYNASNELKNTIKNWDPSKYLNIWSVSTIASDAAAWSHYPGISPTYDGIVSKYQYINSNDHTIAHEMGHYLNLPHPWGSTNDPGLSTNCNTDDGVEDTPNTIGVFGSCNTNFQSCGSLDNVQNIMDYSSCPAMFTMGQVDRMDAALSSTISSRNNLWTENNLVSTGTNDGYVDPGVAPIADFDSKILDICPGSEVVYMDFSNGGEATAWEWTFEGGTPETSTEKNASVIYNTPGIYSVSLKATNAFGENTLTRSSLVKVTNTEAGIIAPVIVDMEDNGFPFYGDDYDKTWQIEENSKYPWEVYDASSGNTAMRIKNYGQDEGSYSSLITSNIYLGDIENPDEITFDFAFAKRSSSNNDKLDIYVSKNCGKNWGLRASYLVSQLVTNGGSNVTTEFKPGDHQWAKGSIDFTFNDDDEAVKLKFKMNHGGGNYLYIDNIQVGEPVGVTNINSLNKYFSVYPNPANETLNIKYYIDNAQNTQILVSNVVGEVIWLKDLKMGQGNHIETIDLKNAGISPGVYLVTIKTKYGKETQRIVISK